jgi:phage tail-like protein
MASVVALPRNPLRTYQFRVGVFADAVAAPVAYVAGVKGVSGLRAQVSPWETWEGGNNLHRYANPNKVTWEPVTLEQGLALDDTFERWAQAVLDFAGGLRPNPKEPVKRLVVIDVWDENAYPKDPPAAAPPPLGSSGPATTDAALRVRRYVLRNVWVSKYQPLAKLDSMTSEVSFLSVELVHEGWVRGEVK